MQMQEMLAEYNRQALAMFGPYNTNGFVSPAALNKAVGDQNEAGLFYSGSGFFVDCALEAPIVNLTLNPLFSLANMIPVYPTSDRKMVFGYLSQISGTTGSYPDFVCDDSPVVGDPSFCKAEFDIGRISYQTKTLEVDALIEKAHRGVREDFYLVGSVRGTSALPSSQQLSDRDFVKRAAVRRQMMLVGRAFQHDLINQFWNGDPTNLTQNTTNGGRKEFWGLLNLIANDYASKAGVTGTNCAALNSDVKDFGGPTAVVGDGTANFYALLQELEDTLYQRAALMGLLPTEWVIVMHPVIWSQLVKYLPCEMMGDGCVRPGVSTNPNGTVFIGPGDGMSQVFLRNQMMNSMTIEVNGRTHRVVLDHGLPIVADVTPTTYTGSVLMIPMRVAGEPVLFWRHKDYSLIESQLAPIPGSQTDMLGWSDGGRYHWVIENHRRCFVIDGKLEVGLVFTAPQLAGRIDNVTVSPLQAKPNWQAYLEPEVEP